MFQLLGSDGRTRTYNLLVTLIPVFPRSVDYIIAFHLDQAFRYLVSTVPPAECGGSHGITLLDKSNFRLHRYPGIFTLAFLPKAAIFHSEPRYRCATSEYVQIITY